MPTGTNDYTNTKASGETVGPGTTSGLSESLLREGIGALGSFWNATVKASPNLIPDSGADSSGGAYVAEGLIYVSELEPRSDPDTSDKSLRGAVELNYWGSYVWGVYRAGAYGVEIRGDVTLPAAT